MMRIERQLKSHQFWQIWVAWLGVVFLIHALTFSTSPPIWQDEVQIIEWGRTVLEPGTDWSINWDSVKNAAVIYPLYLGALVQNFLFTLSGHSVGFPRLLSSAGALVASTACLLLLLSYGHGRLRSALLSSLFLLDPLFVAGYKGDRIDAWAMAALFLSCLALQNVVTQGKDHRVNRRSALVAGCISGFGLAIWFSYILLLPLIAWQIVSAATDSNWRRIPEESGIIFRLSAFWLLGLAGSLFLIELPVLLSQPDSFMYLSTATAKVTQNANPISALAGFLSAFRRNPLILVLTTVCIMSRPKPDLLFFSGLALIGILKSNPYDNRAVYLLPYLILLCSYSLDYHSISVISRQPSRLLATSKTILLWLSLAVSIVVSLVLRPLNALATGNIRQPERIDEVASTAIGMGDHKVLVGPWEFYVAGRRLGWKMYKPMFQNVSRKDISGMDFVILSVSDAKAKKSLLSGFMPVGNIWLPTTPNQGGSARRDRAPGYGPYMIYRNPGSVPDAMKQKQAATGERAPS